MKKNRTLVCAFLDFVKRLFKLLLEGLRAPQDTKLPLDHIDILFFSSDADRTDSIRGLAYSRVLTPLAGEFEKSGYSVASIAYPGGKIVGPGTIGPIGSITRFMIRAEIFALVRSGIRWFAEHQAASRSMTKAAAYEKLLLRLQPKAVCVIDADSSLCFAGHRVRVPVLEILHARGYGDVYKEWKDRAPSELPDGVVAYDDLSAETFGRLLPTLRVPNFRTSFELEMARSFLQDNPPPFAEFANKLRHVILFTASYNPEICSWPGGVPDELIELIKREKDLFLLIRSHPVMRIGLKYREARLALHEKTRDIPNCDTEWASTAPLYAALEVSTIHFTFDSMSAYEATDVGLRTYAIGKASDPVQSHMKDLVKQGFLRELELDAILPEKALSESVLEFPQTMGEADFNVERILDFAVTSSKETPRDFDDDPRNHP